MSSPVDPHRFTGLPLVPVAIAEDDYSVSIDGMRAGRIMRQPRAFGRATWLWSITGPAMVQASLASSGEADTLEEARTAFRHAFNNWLTWATAQQGTVHWYG